MILRADSIIGARALLAAVALAASASACVASKAGTAEIPQGAVHEAATRGSAEATRGSAEAAPAPSAPAVVYGEFEDTRLFLRELRKRPEMASWSAKGVWEGLSGATIQYKTYGKAVPDRVVLVDGVEAAYADGFGQFWIEVAPGERVITGRCAGFKDAEVRILAEPGSTHYLNLFLKK